MQMGLHVVSCNRDSVFILSSVDGGEAQALHHARLAPASRRPRSSSSSSVLCDGRQSRLVSRSAPRLALDGLGRRRLQAQQIIRARLGGILAFTILSNQSTAAQDQSWTLRLFIWVRWAMGERPREARTLTTEKKLPMFAAVPRVVRRGGTAAGAAAAYTNAQREGSGLAQEQ